MPKRATGGRARALSLSRSARRPNNSTVGAHNATSICDAADADPGPRQLLRAPACVALRLGIFAIGVGGLWVTRSLYGTVQVHAAQFSRFV